MARQRRSAARSRLTLALLILTSVTLLTLDSRGFGPLDGARSAVLGVLSPVGDAAGSVVRPIGDAWEGATSQGSLREENEELRQQVLELEGQVADGEAAARELEQLQDQLDLGFAEDLPPVRARVVSGSVGNFDQTLEIDKGSSAGIRRNMPVVAGSGLVGQVAQVSSGRSIVQLITDPSFQVGVRVPGEPGLGILEGRGDGIPLDAGFDLRTELEEDDLLVTAGTERSFYPPDLPVGRVQEVRRQEALLSQEAEVDLLVEVNDLVYVTVLLWEQDA